MCAVSTFDSQQWERPLIRPRVVVSRYMRAVIHKQRWVVRLLCVVLGLCAVVSSQEVSMP